MASWVGCKILEILGMSPKIFAAKTKRLCVGLRKQHTVSLSHLTGAAMQEPYSRLLLVAAGALQIFVYELPSHIERWPSRANHFDQHWYEDYVRASKHYTSKGEDADYFWIPPFKPCNLSHILSVFHWIKTAHPYWNSSHARHIYATTYDYGPGDIFPRPIRLDNPVIPDDVNPMSPNRNVIYLNLNSVRDGVDSNQTQCAVCFQGGKDIVLSTGESTCGPLCGYSKDRLRQQSMWSSNYTKPDTPKIRRHLLFFGGSIHDRKLDDYSGRGALYARYRSKPGYHIINTALPDNETGDFAAEMQDSDFCYSPRGSNGGDTDRYMAGLMFGCIPVFLSHTSAGERMALPFDEVIPWVLFSTSIAWKDLDNLDTQLHALLPHVGDMRHHMKLYVKQLLYTSRYGSYFGESSDHDAMHTLMRILRLRLINKTVFGYASHKASDTIKDLV